MARIEPYRDAQLPGRFLQWLERLRQVLRPIPEFKVGDGSPEGVVKGGLGDRYYNRSGSSGSRLWVKTTDGGDTGWDAYG